MAEKFFNTKQTNGSGPTQALTLLSGPPSSGKTSLLFQYALNCALEGNEKVVFICNKRRLESKPPFLSQGIEPSGDVLQRIQMKYVEDDDALKKYFAAFHLHDSFPSVVIIDDFGDFFSNSEKLQSKEHCKLLIADTHQGDNPRLLFIYKRWIQCIFTIQGNGAGSFFLRNITSAGGRTERMKMAKYSIALQYLVLEEIEDE